MKRISFLLLVLLLAGCAAPQTKPQQGTTAAPQTATQPPPSMSGLGPFSLGMPMDAALKKISVPTQDGKDEHGGTYHAFQVSQAGGYMAVMSAPFRPAYVYGIQISGGSDVKMDPVLGVKLGDTAEAILTHVGEPSDKMPEPDMGRDLWTYDGRNYSFETDSTGHLVSILVYGYEGIVAAMGWEPNWERYVPNSIAAVIETDRAGWEDSDYYIPAGGIRLRPRVTYTGEVRDTSADVLAVIKDFMDTTPANLKPEAFSKSIKVVEDGQEYWLPTQEQVIKAMQGELKPGDATDLFAIWVGASHKGKFKAVVVNEYCRCD